jgi:hypothetical protein
MRSGGCDTVGKVDKSKAAKTGDLLYRYLWARHRCVGAPAPSDPSWLAYLIEWGKKKFDNVYVAPDESPPIVWDNQHPAFFSAMVRMDYGDTPRPGVWPRGGPTCSTTVFHPKGPTVLSLRNWTEQAARHCSTNRPRRCGARQ